MGQEISPNSGEAKSGARLNAHLAVNDF